MTVPSGGLESAAQADAKDVAWSTTTRLFVSLVKHDEGAEAILMALADVFPWVRFLPREDVQGFVVELVEVAHACAELDTMAPLEAVVTAWRITANAYADPKLRAALLSASEGADHGAVSRPRPGTKRRASGAVADRDHRRRPAVLPG